MPKTNKEKEDDTAARIIKDLEQRIANLEEQSRSDPSPNLLISETDTVGADDRVDGVRDQEITTATWGSPGWRTSSWGAYSRV